MVCFVPSVCLSIRKSCQRRDCSELGTVRNWVDHCTQECKYLPERPPNIGPAIGFMPPETETER